MKAGPPAERLRHVVGRASRHHGYGERPDTNDPSREQHTRTRPSKRTQRFSRLGCSLDVGLAAGVERGSSRHYDEIHNYVGEQHADEHIAPAARELSIGGPNALRKASLAILNLLLDLLVGLNEAADAALKLLREWGAFPPSVGGARPMHRPVQSDQRRWRPPTLDTSKGRSRDDFPQFRRAALVEGRRQASNAEVAMGDLFATANPLTIHADNNLLSPFSNIRAIPLKLCSRLSLAIIEGHRA